MLVFVPADASSISDRGVILETPASRKRSIELLSERGRGPHPHDGSERVDRGGPSAIESVAVVPMVSDAAVHAASTHSAGGAMVDASHSGGGIVVRAPDADDDEPGGVVIGASQVMAPTSHEGQEVALPPGADAPE
jgi:hypothetical protein